MPGTYAAVRAGRVCGVRAAGRSREDQGPAGPQAADVCVCVCVCVCVTGGTGGTEDKGSDRRDHKPTKPQGSRGRALQRRRARLILVRRACFIFYRIGQYLRGEGCQVSCWSFASQILPDTQDTAGVLLVTIRRCPAGPAGSVLLPARHARYCTQTAVT